MRKRPLPILLLLLLFIVTSDIAFGQNQAYEKAAQDFESSYNADRYDSIFATFSASMQKAVPLSKITEFLTELKVQLGKIKTAQYTSPGDTVSTYKLTFEKGIRILKLALDNHHQIQGLLILPWKPAETAIGADSIQQINVLTGMPAAVQLLILKNMKDFPGGTQLAMAMIHKGQIAFYGVLKNKDSLKTIQNSQRIFEIGSLTKVFTATLLAQAVEAKKIALTDRINTYYDFPFKQGTDITFLQLANHSSGLLRLPSNFIYSDNPYKDYTAQNLRTYLKDGLQLESKPGEKYSYSNLGGGLLGYTLGLVEKSDYASLLHKNIFKKYRMTHSFTSSKDTKGNLLDGLVEGLDKNGHRATNWDFDVLMGAGGVLSTASDLARFALAEFNPDNKAMALTRKPTFTVDQHMKVALGWHIIKLPGSRKEVIWHAGGTAGYTASIALDTAEKDGVIILSNVSAFNAHAGNIDDLCFELLNLTHNKSRP